MKITIKKLEKWNSCYSHDDHVRLFGDRKYFTPIEIANADNVPAKDRVWVLLHKGIFTSSELRLLSCDFAEYALSKVDNPDPRSLNSIKISRLYAVGKATKSELAAARAAARAAAWSAARHLSAARAWDTAWSAARSAARDVAWSAVWSAVWPVESDATYTHFLQLIKAKLEDKNAN